MRRMYDKEEIKEIAAEFGGSKVDSLDLVVGQPTVTYDTTDGITIESTGKLNGTDDIVVSNEIPIVAGEGISIDKAADKEQIVIKSTGSVDTSKFIKTSGVPFTGNIQFQTIEESSTSPSQIFIYSTSKQNSGTSKCGAGLILHTASNYYNPPFLSIGTTGSHATGDYAFSQMSANPSGSNSANEFIRIDTKTIAYYSGSKKYVVDFPNRYSSVTENTTATICTNKTLKTLFGKQSIYSENGSGNIDLFCHNISFQDKVFFTAYSSDNSQVQSLTDLQTLFPADVWKSATGVSPDDTKVVCAINCSQMKVRYTDNTESSLAEFEAPVDTVNTI